MKRIYLSGPMTGMPDWNFPAFNAEAARLRALGYDVVNPADINPDTTTPYNECLRHDLQALLTCDTIAMLDGWMDSNGAHLEMHIAHRVGIKVIEAKKIVEPAVPLHDAGCLFAGEPITSEDICGCKLRVATPKSLEAVA